MHLVFRIAFVTLLIFAACDFARADVRVTAKPSFDSAKTFQRLEWEIQLDRKYDNPFDPDQIAVDAKFMSAGKQAIVVPAFWNKDRFTLRFAPPAAGAWSVAIVAKDSAGTRESAPQTFNVINSDNGNENGFVRRTPDNPRYLQFDSGKPYFVLGLNIAWAGSRGIGAYETWFGELSKNGGNFARVWMSHPSMMTETVDAGLGRYDQDACAFYDAVFDHAQRKGIYCMVTFNNYRDLRATDEWGPATWPRFPYNAANGGPATRPADFFTHADCQRLYRQRLRYIVARWSAYTSVAMWELWNEQTFTQVNIPPAWTRDMARYLRDVDPYDHLISTSFGEGEQAEVWQMPEIDWTQSHLYPGDQCDDASTPIASSSYVHRRFNKPHFVSEFGIDPFAPDAKSDPDGVGTNLHNGIWASMMSGGAGGACLWWWDNYVDPKNLWHTFAGPAAFSRRVEWNKRKFEPLLVPPPTSMPAASSNADETFSDIVITSALPWGRAHGEPINVFANGQATRALPQFLYGPRKPAYQTPTVFRVDLPRATTMVVRVSKVSDHATMRVSVDRDLKRDFFFSALPGAAGQKKTEFNAHKVYEAVFEQDCPIELPAGRHDVMLDIVGGDWMTVRSVTFAAAKSSQFADLHVLALQDATSGETLAWLRDPASNWQNDRAKVPPRTITEARMKVPVSRDSMYQVEWWDARSGTVIRTEQVKADQAALNLAVPPVCPDIALRAVVAESP